MSIQRHKEHSSIEEMQQRSHLKSWGIELQRLIKLVQIRAARYGQVYKSFVKKIIVKTLGEVTISLIHLIKQYMEHITIKDGNQIRPKSWGTKAENFSKKCSTMGSLPNFEIWRNYVGQILKIYWKSFEGHLEKYFKYQGPNFTRNKL